MARFVAAEELTSLKSFQLRTVDHVIDRLYDSPHPSRRFLVADETGLGKSLVARGVIARAIEKLQDEKSVQRIDIVYVCSNAEIARQNLQRLNVTGDTHLQFGGRLTLLARNAAGLRTGKKFGGKVVNLVSFTPGTSFEMGWRTGTVEERALLHALVVEALDLTSWDERASRVIMEMTASRASLDRAIERLDEIEGGIDTVISQTFRSGAKKAGLLRQYAALVEQVGRRRSLTDETKKTAQELVGKLRGQLARASVETLEPDLVILDEFQRFRKLLDPVEGGEAAELANALFTFRDARVLLLSATPYKPFTYAEESQDDHERDFAATLGFLAEDSPVDPEAVRQDLTAHRKALIARQETAEIAARIRDQLTQVMSRTERPQLEVDQLVECNLDVGDVRSEDLVGYARLQEIAKIVDSGASVEYWKSVPYFVNFMDGYQVGDRVRDALRRGSAGPELQEAVLRAQRLPTGVMSRRRQLDPGNARLRALSADTVERGWWQLLWMPPSMAYFQPGGPYATVGDVSKRLIFSSWSAAPTAIASLLSYEADRRTRAGSGSGSPVRRLDYRLDRGEPGAMTALALFWPHPGLAAIGDPLVAARRSPDDVVAHLDWQRSVRAEVSDLVRATNVGPAGDGAHWLALMKLPNALAPQLTASRVGAAMSGQVDDDSTETGAGLAAHVERALSAISDVPQAAGTRAQLADTLTHLAINGPANIAWRSLSRLLDGSAPISPESHWEAAATLAAGLRTLFNRAESAQLLDQLYTGDEPYWQKVLRYCGDGNLQAVLDEYLHILRDGDAGTALTDELLVALAGRARDALSLRPSTYQALDPENPETPIGFPAKFALRYGGGRRLDQDSARLPQVREAFNSPFWPFVLASTSVGQEGIDFHWYSHSIVHWNLPANPIDFEQREGRVNRFGGLAIRKNLAAAHRAHVMGSDEIDPWKAAYDLAIGEYPELGDFSPYWVYPGETKVQRILPTHALSRDAERTTQLKTDLTLYRLALGQPRQEDLIGLLRAGSLGSDRTPLDLAPPSPSVPTTIGMFDD